MISEVRNSLWKYPVALLAGGFIFFRRLCLSFTGESATEEDGVLNITPLQGLNLTSHISLPLLCDSAIQEEDSLSSIILLHYKG
jgi:hypothetical protein